MTPAGRVAWALAEQLGELDPAAMGRHPAFREAAAVALAVVDEAALVEQVVRQGGLAGSRNAHAVIVGRLRQLPSLAAERRQVADDRAESARWRRVDAAARRGETLRALVDAGSIFADEAMSMLASEFGDDDLRGIASAALTGRSS